MLALMLAVVCTAGLLIIFRAFPAAQINPLHAIAVNYGVAAAWGWSFAGGPTALLDSAHLPWVAAGALGGLGFIFIFRLTATSTVEWGMATTSVASKLSLVIPSGILLALHPTDHPNALKLAGMACALPAVVLSSWPEPGAGPRGRWWIPLALFFGGGAVDLLFAWYGGAEHMTSPEHPYLFAALPFTTAFFTGLLVLGAERARSIRTTGEPVRWSWRDVAGGLVLGTVNFGSLYFLLESYARVDLDRSAIVPVLNLGVVVLSATVGFLLFGERVRRTHAFGLALGVLAILLFLAGG